MSAATALALAAVAAAPAAQAEPIAVAPPDADAFSPVSLAIDGAGATTVAWAGSTTPYVSRATVRSPDSAAFAPPFTLVPADQQGLFQALAAGTGGASAILFRKGYVSGDEAVRVKPAGAAAYGPPITAAPQAPGRFIAGQALAVDARGDVTVVWSEVRLSDTQSTVLAATLPAGATAFSPPVTLAPYGGHANELSVAVDAAGAATATWIRDVNGRGQSVRDVTQAVHRDAGQSAWSAPQNLSADGSGGSSATDKAEHPRIAAGPDGGVTVAWVELVRGLADVVQVARRLPGASAFGPAQTLSDPSANIGAANVELAADPSGDAVVAWDIAPADITIGSPVITARAGASGRAGGSPRAGRAHPAAAPPPRRVQTAFAAAGAAGFGAAVDVSAPTHYSDHPHLAANPRGGFVLEFNAEPETLTQLTTRGPGPDSRFGAFRTIAAVYDPRLAVGPDGDATVAWTRDRVPYVADADATAPTADGLQVPASGFAGQPVTVSVMPHDRLSPLVASAWEFGDGTSASGDTVSHTYAEPGPKRVTATVADVLGNGASVTRTIMVVPPPVEPGRPGPGGGGSGARRPLPRITRASLSPRRVRPARRGGLLVARRAGRSGTRLRFRVSEAGTVALTLARVVPGRRAGRARRCSTGARRGRRCTVVRTVAHGSKRVRAGLVTLVLSGRANGHALPRGDYRLQLRLTDAARARSPLVTLKLRVVR